MIVYAMQPVDGGPVKIGVTNNLKTRKKAHETMYGKTFAVLATWQGGAPLERAIHVLFAHLRLRGPDPRGRGYEQFRPTLELMTYLGRPELAHDDIDSPLVPVPRSAVPRRRRGAAYQHVFR